MHTVIGTSKNLGKKSTSQALEPNKKIENHKTKKPILPIHEWSREIMHVGGVLLLKQKGL
jgi:hypothetical protein